MFTALLIVLVLQCFLMGVLLHQLRRMGVLPEAFEIEDGESYDTLRLYLCAGNGEIRHEVSFHGLQPPSRYSYGGRDYRYGEAKGGGVYEYFEIG